MGCKGGISWAAAEAKVKSRKMRFLKLPKSSTSAKLLLISAIVSGKTSDTITIVIVAIAIDGVHDGFGKESIVVMSPVVAIIAS